MPLTSMDTRAILVRSRARKFAATVRDSNMAVLISNDDLDWLHDSEIEPFKQHLRTFGLTQRPDLYWEHTRDQVA